MRRVILIFLFLLNTIYVYAQPQTYMGNTDRFTTRNGLPHNTVTSVFQDSVGILWVGTVNGLCTYDGINFTPVKIPFDVENPWSQVVHSIYQDREGTLWFGTRAGHILSLDKKADQWHQRGKVDTPYVTGFCQDNSGRLWMGTLTGNIGAYDYQDNSCRWMTNVDFTINDVYVDEQHNKIWVSGISCITALNMSTMKEFQPLRWLECPIPTQATIGMNDKGLFFWCHEDSCMYFDINQNKMFSAREIAPYSEEIIYYHGRFIYVVNTAGGRRVRYLASEEQGDFVINDIKKDQSGLIWVATNVGLIKIDPQKYHFRGLSTDKGDVRLDNNYVRALAVTDSAVWLGFKEGPVTELVYDTEERTFSKKRNYTDIYREGELLDHLTTNAILMRRNGEVWCGGLEGLFVKNPRTSLFEITDMRGENGDPVRVVEVWALGEDTSGAVWVGTRASGLWRIGADGKDTRVSLNSERDLSIWKIHTPEDGAIWLGTSGGLFHIQSDPEGRMQVSSVHELEGIHIWDIKSDAQGSLYLASTNSGFWIYDPFTGALKNFTQEDGLPSNSVCGIERDTSGTLWLSTINGLCHFDPATATAINYFEEDGLVSNDFNFSICDQSSRGELFFGTKNGLLTFFPEECKKTDSSKANMIVRTLLINGEDMTEHLRTGIIPELGHDRNNFRFGFSLLEFRHPLKNSYRYRLVPFDRVWKKTSGRLAVAEYTNLPPGDYSFEVEGSTDGIHWRKNLKTMKFSIRPAIWQRPWFLPVVFSALTIVILTAFNYRYSVKLRSERAKSETERTIASLELRALQSQMNPHFIFNAMNSIQEFILTGDTNSANDYLTRFARLMRYFLEASVNRKVRLNEEIDMMRLYLDLESLRFGSGFSYEIICPHHSAIDLIEIPSMLIQPYVENAIHHGLMPGNEKGHVTVEIKLYKEDLIIIIDDNGIGREASAKLKDSLNRSRVSRAMQLMEERMEAYGMSGEGNIGIEIIDKKNMDGSSAGTRVIMTLTDQIG